MAATLANSGLCPTTGKKILGENAVRDTLTLMHSCGMYDKAGEFSFAVSEGGREGGGGRGVEGERVRVLCCEREGWRDVTLLLSLLRWVSQPSPVCLG